MQKIHLKSISLLLGILIYTSNYAFASANFNFYQDKTPTDTPKHAIVNVTAQDRIADPYKEDLLLSVQNEFLLSGLDIVIGKENIVDNNTLSLDISFSIENGLRSHILTKNNHNYFVENISRAKFKIKISSLSQNSPFIDLDIALDSQIIGLTDNGYDSIETMNSIFTRAAGLMANLVFANFSDNSDITGTWRDTLGTTVIIIKNKQGEDEYIGHVHTKNKHKIIGFSVGETIYQFQSNVTNKQKIEGKYKVSYSDGKEPAWFPAEFIIYGNMLIMKPISLNAPVVMSFYIKQR
ncbi:MAG: hypothetical protein ABW115_04980 [Candidatus Thiodiazotropha sp. 6PLUC6]